MEEYPGLSDMKANFEKVTEIEDDLKFEVILSAIPQPMTAARYVELGWVRNSDNSFVWYKQVVVEPPPDEEVEEL